MPIGFAVAGVHMTLAAVFQSCSTVHPVALDTHHLNPAVPPVAAAVSVIVVPAGCGDVRSAVSVTAVREPLTTLNGRSAYASGAFFGFPALRAHTSNVYWPGVAGVHGRVVAGLHSCSTVHPLAPRIHHLNSAVPPVAAA